MPTARPECGKAIPCELPCFASSSRMSTSTPSGPMRTPRSWADQSSMLRRRQDQRVVTGRAIVPRALPEAIPVRRSQPAREELCLHPRQRPPESLTTRLRRCLRRREPSLAPDHRQMLDPPTLLPSPTDAADRRCYSLPHLDSRPQPGGMTRTALYAARSVRPTAARHIAEASAPDSTRTTKVLAASHKQENRLYLRTDYMFRYRRQCDDPLAECHKVFGNRMTVLQGFRPGIEVESQSTLHRRIRRTLYCHPPLSIESIHPTRYLPVGERIVVRNAVPASALA